MNLENFKLVKNNYQPAIDNQLTPTLYVDKAIDETSSFRQDQDNDFINFNLTNVRSITLNTQALIDIKFTYKLNVDQVH